MKLSLAFEKSINRAYYVGFECMQLIVTITVITIHDISFSLFLFLMLM